MDNDDFIRQYARYLDLKQKSEKKLSAEEKMEKDLIYTNIKNYVITGEELLESSLPEYFSEKSFEDKDLASKLERVRKEIEDKQGILVDRIKLIISSD